MSKVYVEENIVIGSATTHFGGKPIGWTKDALTIGIDIVKKEINDVQQKFGLVDVRRVGGNGFVIKLNMYENTLENWRLAFGINSTVSYGASVATLSFLMTGDFHEGELRVATFGPDNVARTLLWWRAKLTEVGDVSMDAYDVTIIPATFQILVHPDHTDFGKVEEEYVPSAVV